MYLFSFFLILQIRLCYENRSERMTTIKEFIDEYHHNYYQYYESTDEKPLNFILPGNVYYMNPCLSSDELYYEYEQSKLFIYHVFHSYSLHSIASLVVYMVQPSQDSLNPIKALLQSLFWEWIPSFRPSLSMVLESPCMWELWSCPSPNLLHSHLICLLFRVCVPFDTHFYVIMNKQRDWKSIHKGHVKEEKLKRLENGEERQ